jgi:nitrate/TMAO reductase-like tetraheme cytochrome c subunit
MSRTAKSKLFVVVAAVVLVVVSAIHAKQPENIQAPTQGSLASAQDKPGEQKPAGQQPHPETLQILKGMPRPQIIQEMRKIAAALGVECNFCHINPFDAETPRKAVARLMMRDYTMGMKHKDGTALSCNDCHKGQPNPLRTSPFDGAVGKKLADREVLKGLPQARLMEVMTAFTKALGVECNYCHTSKFDEATPRLQIARFMVSQFAQGLVKTDGSAVGCNDCHQGHARPLTVLPFPKRPERKPEPQPAKKPDGPNFLE